MTKNALLRTDEDSGHALQSYIVFELMGTHYGLRSAEVQHLEMVENITPLPNAAPFVEGVINTRGNVIPVLNLRTRFGFEKATTNLRTRLLVVNSSGRQIGLLVDTAREFLHIPAEVIHPPQESITELSGKYLQGIAVYNDRVVLILNLGEIINTGDWRSQMDAVTTVPVLDQKSSATIR